MKNQTDKTENKQQGKSMKQRLKLGNNNYLKRKKLQTSCLVDQEINKEHRN